MLKIGDKAPDFGLLNEKNEIVSLKNFSGRKVILYFYPKDNTPGCTAEACDFRDNFGKFKKNNTVILGVSKDSVNSHLNFSSKFNLPFHLLSDAGGETIKKYGVLKEKSMYGRKYLGIERSTFIIDEKGFISDIFTKVKVKGHADILIGTIEKLNSK